MLWGPSRHLGSLTAANWVSFDFNVSYSSCWGYSLINTFKLKKKILFEVMNLPPSSLSAQFAHKSYLCVRVIAVFSESDIHDLTWHQASGRYLDFIGNYLLRKLQKNMVVRTRLCNVIRMAEMTWWWLDLTTILPFHTSTPNGSSGLSICVIRVYQEKMHNACTRAKSPIQSVRERA